MVYLTNEKSICGKNQIKIVSRDRGASVRHEANNVQGVSDVRQYQLDGDVFNNEKTCDFLVLNDSKRDAYFIELKGSDILHGIEQLEVTVSKLQGELIGYTKYYRLVFSKANTHAVASSRFLGFKRRHYGYFKYQKKEIVENI